jgi:hypothetical protein
MICICAEAVPGAQAMPPARMARPKAKLAADVKIGRSGDVRSEAELSDM